jgi:catechol 2,3-dioxygenase
MPDTNQAAAPRPARNGTHAFRPRRLGHCNLFVTNLDASMNFYTNVVGLEEVYRVPGSGGGFVGNGNTHHDLAFLDFKGPLSFRAVNGKPGLYHLGIELETEVELIEDYKKALPTGIEMRPADHDICHSLYVSSPSGVVSELYADVVSDWRRQRTGIVTKPKPNWKPGDTEPVAEPRYHVDPLIHRLDHAVFHPQRVTHVVMVCDDFEAMYDHYAKEVGFKILEGGRDERKAVFGGKTRERNVFLYRSGPGRLAGCHHMGFVVKDEADLKASISQLASAGITPELVLDHPTRLCVFLTDPDGVRVQLYFDRKPAGPVAPVDEDLDIYLA